MRCIFPSQEATVSIHIHDVTDLTHSQDNTEGVVIQATLPGSGRCPCSLWVEIVGDHPEELGVYWHPEWIEVAPNESKSVQLVLSQPAPLDFVARLTLKEGPHDLVEFPPEVLFPQGSQQVTVPIHAHDVTDLTHTQHNTEGVVIQATLPEDLGGAYAYLKVEIFEHDGDDDDGEGENGDGGNG